tara:strand:- start:7 stop:252 length:246 start_codon:yes stop_codon:yes gene_type:complete
MLREIIDTMEFLDDSSNGATAFRAKSAERALAGSRLIDPAVRAAAEMVIEGALPLSDNGYKCNLIINLTEKALRKNRDQRA